MSNAKTTVTAHRQTRGVYTLTLYPELGHRHVYTATTIAAGGWRLTDFTGDVIATPDTLRKCKAAVARLNKAAAARAFAD